MTAARTRVLAIGIDAASAELLEAWMADGTLPHLKALVDRGTSGRLGGVDGFFVGSTWPSLYTGTGPARHGFHYQLQIVPGTYDLHWRPDGEFIRTEPFWSVLGRNGKRVAALDIPLSRPSPDLNGVQVVEWGGHDALYGFSTSPPQLGDALRERHGLHPQGTNCDARRESADDYRSFLERLEEGVRRKLSWTKELLERGEWDLFVQVFTEGHCAGHQCWHLHDPTHPAHDPGIAADLGDPLRRIYSAIDAAVGEIVATAGDTRVVVFSGHDMSYWHGAQFLLPLILERLGVMRPDASTTKPRRRAWPARAAAVAWRSLPESARAPARRLRNLAARASRGSAPPRIRADVERSQCFPLNNGQAVGGIRLNVAGREPAGCLRPGAETEAFCARLAADLMEITDERTGRPLIKDVRRTAELHDGECLQDLPDLLVYWNDLVPTGSTELAAAAGATVRATSPRIGVVEGANQYGRTGEHRPGGWFVAAGPGIAPGMARREVPLIDLAPSLTAMLGISMPEAEGRPAPELTEGAGATACGTA